MEDPGTTELAELTVRAAAAVADGQPTDAAVALLLLRRYLATDAAGLRDVLGLALAHGLASAVDEPTTIGRAAWLTLLVEAMAVSDDERFAPAVQQLVARLRSDWPAQRRIDELSASIDACLRATDVVGTAGGLVQEAIDHLERAIGGSYRPGAGLVSERDGVRVPASDEDHVRSAAALLTAFELTGRLPYSMLAEELIAIAMRDRSAGAELEIQCLLARVLGRLAWLHDDPDYRGAVTVAAGSDYRAQALQLLSTQSARAFAGTAAAAAAYGLALGELLRHVR